MTRTILLTSIVFLALFLVVDHSNSEIVDYLVAVVNGEPITMSMLEDAINAFWIAPENLPKTTKDALEQLIDRKLELQEANKRGIFVTEEELSSELNRISSKFPSKENLYENLKQRGMTSDDLQERLTEEIMIRKMVERKFGQFIRDSDLEGEATDFFEQNKTKFVIPESVQIDQAFFKIDPSSDASTKETVRIKAEEALNEIRKGANFSKYTGGGRSGYINVNQLSPNELAEAISGMKIGEIKGLIEAPTGYYIIRLNDQRTSRQATFNEVKDQIEAQLRQQKIKADLEAELKKQREAVEIKINSPIK
jgi:peptidyl-prolyl cis-trans isomerase SurA